MVNGTLFKKKKKNENQHVNKHWRQLEMKAKTVILKLVRNKYLILLYWQNLITMPNSNIETIFVRERKQTSCNFIDNYQI